MEQSGAVLELMGGDEGMRGVSEGQRWLIEGDEDEKGWIYALPGSYKTYSDGGG